MTDPVDARAADNAALAALLWRNVDVVLRELRGDGAPSSPMSALVATRTTAEVIEDVTRVLVGEARRSGHTWAEIGRLLRISRQAAQQRFTDGIEVDDVGGLGRRAVEIVEQIRDGDLDAVMADWDELMRERLSADDVRAVWTRVSHNAGALEAIGRASVVPSGPYRIADVPLAFAFGAMRARVTFNRDDSVAGLFILAPDATEIEENISR